MLPYQSNCDCECHDSDHHIIHCMPCCQPDPKTYVYKGTKCWIQESKYSINEARALRLDSDQGPLAVITINLPEVDLKSNRILVKDYSENAGMLDWLIDNQIVKYTGIKHRTGFVYAHECIYDPN